MAKHDPRGDEEMWRGTIDLAFALVDATEDQSDRGRRGGKASGESRSGANSKKEFILAEAAQLSHLPRATLVNEIVKRYAKKNKGKVTPRYVRDVLAKK